MDFSDWELKQNVNSNFDKKTAHFSLHLLLTKVFLLFEVSEIIPYHNHFHFVCFFNFTTYITMILN